VSGLIEQAAGQLATYYRVLPSTDNSGGGAVSMVGSPFCGGRRGFC